jgi:hypothetical protein
MCQSINCNLSNRVSLQTPAPLMIGITTMTYLVLNSDSLYIQISTVAFDRVKKLRGKKNWNMKMALCRIAGTG